MDDLIDDDFGDLYADVEVQATSAINSVENFVKHSQADGDVGNNIKQPKDESPVLESELLDSIQEKLGDYSDADGSDSEDDLNIVLNDEDCQRFSVSVRRNGLVGGYEDGEEKAMAEEEEKDTCGGGAFCTGQIAPNGYYMQYPRNKMVRHHGSSFPSVFKGSKSVVAASCYWRSLGGDMEDNSRRKLKVSNLGQVIDRSAASHGRYGFSLPWYRTILDVDIDAFEEKGWRYPGVDLTDFFNFGFNEDSWRQYCISLQQFRQQSSYMNSRIQTRESSKHFQLLIAL
uniref:Uncharacterized protein MANES_03G204700 n=1 Tax=Rhizophora mucronata TaxID=61149 RepID=A0A2P2JBB2_RHIMU